MKSVEPLGVLICIVGLFLVVAGCFIITYAPFIIIKIMGLLFIAAGPFYWWFVWKLRKI